MRAGGLELQPEGDGRWLLVEAGRPEPEAVVATLVRGADGITVEGAGGLPPGPYSSPEDALVAYEQFRLARWNGDR